MEYPPNPHHPDVVPDENVKAVHIVSTNSVAFNETRKVIDDKEIMQLDI